MKRIVLSIVLLITLLGTSIVYAAGEPPAGLAGTLVITSQSATSVTLYAKQTGGTIVILKVYHYCYSNGIYAGVEKVRFQGSTFVTFNIGPRIYHGQYLVPTDCWALLEYDFSGTRAIILAQTITLGQY